jgi:hypothetical protein
MELAVSKTKAKTLMPGIREICGVQHMLNLV